MWGRSGYKRHNNSLVLYLRPQIFWCQSLSKFCETGSIEETLFMVDIEIVFKRLWLFKSVITNWKVSVLMNRKNTVSVFTESVSLMKNERYVGLSFYFP
jgi:hypothetical protein